MGSSDSFEVEGLALFRAAEIAAEMEGLTN